MRGSVAGLSLLVGALGVAAAGCAAAGHTATGPAPVHVTGLADVVGIWEGIPGVDPKSAKDTASKAAPIHVVAIGADSTFSEVIMKGSQASCGGGTLRVTGDSVFWKEQARTTPHKIVVKNQNTQFFLYPWADLTKPIEAYQRSDTTKTPKPKIFSTLAQCGSQVRRSKPAPSPAPKTP